MAKFDDAYIRHSALVSEQDAQNRLWPNGSRLCVPHVHVSRGMSLGFLEFNACTERPDNSAVYTYISGQWPT